MIAGAIACIYIDSFQFPGVENEESCGRQEYEKGWQKSLQSEEAYSEADFNAAQATCWRSWV